MQGSLRQHMAAGGPIINGWLSMPSAYGAELMARAGWDSLTVDLQHGVQDYSSMVQCFLGASASGTPMLARVPSLEPGIVGKVLDAGAWGVICPMVNDARSAAALVEACLYPPLGQRSNGPNRAAAFGRPGKPYQSIVNDEVLVLPMIETATAMAALDDILDVPGVGGVYVGPTDLAFSMGLPPVFDSEDPRILDAFARVVEATQARGIVAGVHCGSPDFAARMIAMGFGLVTVGSDASLLAGAARDAVARVRAA
ncbi:HpcH/HpaI aldolase family protein [Chachezhania sediminis]|uniref:HpcH/HpaI aldolase family protein n=1 Tax=Chachezhania sediminis TaxID=2599291 RepID=UPI00131C2752|nr:aldolase/citrate lyase family protein [Chachezhania sediminis]